MGVGGSKHPDWYPGEPVAGVSEGGECSCRRSKSDNQEGGGDAVLATARSAVGGDERSVRSRSSAAAATAAAGEYLENGGVSSHKKREISSLAVVELTDWEVGTTALPTV